MISVLAGKVMEYIVSEIKYCNLIIDETKDISMEQLVLVLRYVVVARDSYPIHNVMS